MRFYLSFFDLIQNLYIQFRNAAPDPEKWLLTQVELARQSVTDEPVLPLNDRGEEFVIGNLYDDQKIIVYRVLAKIHEWMTCDDLSQFVPLRCTIMGPAGTGKSVLINTITSCIRRLFDFNNVALVGCPTGTSAFNAFGETLHCLTAQGISGDYKPHTLSAAKKAILCHKFRHLLCLIVDERSLLTSKLLGNTSQIISETIFEGCNIDELLGGIPVLILAGDDHQLPGITEGGIEALTRIGGTKMTQKGRQVFTKCAETVFQLSTLRRVCDSKQDDKDLMQRIRKGVGITDEDVAKLQSLHLDTIREKHGPHVVADIEEEAIYLFWTNEKRTRHNLQRLGKMNTSHNPTAIIRPKGYGDKFGKSINSHFDSEMPKAALLCLGAKVCIQGQNFQPMWGLHNGACGTVKEIIFPSGHNPNAGHHPSYVVVTFPQYTGPTWDKDNPKVQQSNLDVIIFSTESNFCTHTLTHALALQGCTYTRHSYFV